MFFVDFLSNFVAFRLGQFNFAKSFLDPKGLLQTFKKEIKGDELLITKSVCYRQFLSLFLSIYMYVYQYKHIIIYSTSPHLKSLF